MRSVVFISNKAVATHVTHKSLHVLHTPESRPDIKMLEFKLLKFVQSDSAIFAEIRPSISLNQWRR